MRNIYKTLLTQQKITLLNLLNEKQSLAMDYAIPGICGTVLKIRKLFPKQKPPVFYKRGKTFILCGISIPAKESLFLITGNILKPVCFQQKCGLILLGKICPKIFICLMIHSVGVLFLPMKQTRKTTIFICMLRYEIAV